MEVTDQKEEDKRVSEIPPGTKYALHLERMVFRRWIEAWQTDCDGFEEIRYIVWRRMVSSANTC